MTATATTERRPPDTGSPPATPTPTSAPAPGDDRLGANRRRLLWAVFLAAAALAAVCIRGHAMWFDEIEAWNVARSAHSFSGLLSNLRYDGHPVLWYLPLYGLSRFTGDPRAMQVLEWIVLCGVYAVVLFRAPFPVPFRVAIVAGYILTFEYGIMSRGYGLGVLWLLLGSMWLGRPRPAWGKAETAFVLLAWTNLAGAVIAIAVASTVAWDLWWTRRHADEPADTHARRWFTGTVLVAAAVSAVTCVPPPDFASFSQGIATTPLGTLSPARFAATLAGPWRGLFPVPTGVGGWNTNMLDPLPASVWVQAAVGVAVVVLVALALRPYRFAFALWIVGTLGFYAFSIVVVLPDRSHYAGESFLLFLVCMWLAWAPPAAVAPSVGAADAVAADPSRTRSVRLVTVAAVVLGAQVVATLAIVPDRTVRPFAPDRTLARAVVRAGMTNDVVSGQDFDAVTMSGYLDRPVYSVARGEWIRIFVNDQKEADGNWRLTSQKVICAAADLAHARAHPVALVVDKTLRARNGVTRLASSQGVSVYRVDRSVWGTTECSRQE
jgi:hypothetical protein